VKSGTYIPLIERIMVVSLKSKAKIALAIDSDAAMTLSPPSSSFFVEFFFLKFATPIVFPLQCPPP
jgi:hypothetical protein